MEEVGLIMDDIRFPIGELSVPEQVTPKDIEKWLSEIATYTTRLRAVVDTLTEEDLAKGYREGSWNIRQLVHHIADSQLNMYQRLKLAITSDNPFVPEFDQDIWAVTPDTEVEVESSVKILEGLNIKIVALGQALTEADLKKVFTHEVNGEITVATKIAKLSWHEEHHLAHIRNALAQ